MKTKKIVIELTEEELNSLFSMCDIVLHGFTHLGTEGGIIKKYIYEQKDAIKKHGRKRFLSALNECEAFHCKTIPDLSFPIQFMSKYCPDFSIRGLCMDIEANYRFEFERIENEKEEENAKRPA